ncbi:MAG TPA: FAD-dependent oxidoreductase, partial [Gammaproteobacteria bacterium]|nr:FAD-dependent oxidoreductase [Gammaproteobacteria bacterium]
MSSIIIVGAGWAGLSCAYELTKSGHKVTVIEAAPQIGGRARAVQFNDQVVDNGQHIALGAYNTMRGLMHELNLDPHKLFKILP